MTPRPRRARHRSAAGSSSERLNRPTSALVDGLLALNAELLGRHSTFERTADHVTVDGTRAYRIDREEWEALIDEFEASMAAAVRLAHAEQARLLFATAVGADDRFTSDEVGVVVGIDTAEQF